MLEQTDFKGITAIERIGEHVVENLIVDNSIDETEATDLFYNSETFIQLADKTTKFYQKSWQEICEILRKELNI